MGQVFAASTKSADAPDIEPGLYDGKFEGVEKKFITGGNYGDGDRFEWAFTLLDDDGAVMYEEGDPIVVTGLTSTSTNIMSKTTPRAVRYLKALMTPEEFTAFENEEGVDADALVGRVVQVDVAIKDNGWPQIANVIAKRKARRARSAAASNDEE